VKEILPAFKDVKKENALLKVEGNEGTLNFI